MGVIPLERDKVSRQSIDIAANLLKDGWNLVLFPEGTRGEDDFTIPFKPGGAFLSIRTGVAVVPVHLEGTRRVFTPYTTRIRIDVRVSHSGNPCIPTQASGHAISMFRVEKRGCSSSRRRTHELVAALRRAAQGTTPHCEHRRAGWLAEAWAASARRASKVPPRGQTKHMCADIGDCEMKSAGRR